MFKTKILLKILNFDCPSENITRRLGLEPTNVWQKGDLIYQSSIVRYKENGWQFELGSLESDDWKSQILDLQISLQGKEKIIREFSSLFYVEISCVIYFDEITPSIYLDSKLLNYFSDLNLNIDFDLIQMDMA